ncbi:FliH/SctL family protein [Planctomycetota bacterium]
MRSALNITLARPVVAVILLSEYSSLGVTNEMLGSTPGSEGIAVDMGVSASSVELVAQQAQLTSTVAVLEDMVVKLTQFYEGLLTSHRQEIAKLAMEIARKVLMQKVKDGDYAIEEIIQEALKNAPSQQSVSVHLNPEDLAACHALQVNTQGPLAAVQWISDPTVGKAECLLETPKGVVKSFIDDHLDKIHEALEKAD